MISVLIPYRRTNSYFEECLAHLETQIFRDFEVLFDNGSEVPAIKRDRMARKVNSEILAFIDDDAYPDNDWLLNAYNYLNTNKDLAAVCGPALTPPNDSFMQKASGLCLRILPFAYRSYRMKPRYVDDFPAVNLIVRKSDFDKVGGFGTDFLTGEDTILCKKLVYQLKKSILYTPDVVVYHHRRPLFLPFYKQLRQWRKQRKILTKLGYYNADSYTISTP